eukprot:2012412-Prymnesium_polylepis.3
MSKSAHRHVRDPRARRPKTPVRDGEGFMGRRAAYRLPASDVWSEEQEARDATRRPAHRRAWMGGELGTAAR